MPSGRISKRDQETILEALEELRSKMCAALADVEQEGLSFAIQKLGAKLGAIDAAIHTIRDTMEVYGPCANCGGHGYVFDGTEPIECPVCLGNAEQRTCPQCETPLRESAAGNWNCPWCGWSSIKVVTKSK